MAITLSCRVSKILISSDQTTRPCKSVEVHQTFATPVLQNLKVNTKVISEFTVLSLEPIVARPYVASNTRRAALCWSKSSIGNPSTDQSENSVGCCCAVRNLLSGKFLQSLL